MDSAIVPVGAAGLGKNLGAHHTLFPSIWQLSNFVWQEEEIFFGAQRISGGDFMNGSLTCGMNKSESI